LLFMSFLPRPDRKTNFSIGPPPFTLEGIEGFRLSARQANGGFMDVKTRILFNDHEILLNGFTQKYIANVITAIARSFLDEASDIIVCIDDGELAMFSGSRELVLEKDFANQLIQNTIKGMLSPLKGIFWQDKITILVTR